MTSRMSYVELIDEIDQKDHWYRLQRLLQVISECSCSNHSDKVTGRMDVYKSY